MEDKVKIGDKVLLHYVGSFKDGTIFDSSRERNEPFEFIVGGGQVIPGFENNIVGMKVGEKKRFEVSHNDAYGDYREDLKFSIDKNSISEDIEYEIGTVLTLENDKEETLYVTVVEIGEDKVVLDANHPMAGKDLVFEVEIVKIN
ncbi:MAG: peptidylprolyl isomerase [Spirochaetes bacterium]|nr:peptidylprolyl isomerase [Spirochaetota bacterium]